MAEATIGFNMDLVLQNLQTLIGLGDVVPPKSEMTTTLGASTGAASDYHERLSIRAQELGQLVERIRLQLEESHDAIKKTVDDFHAKDAEQAAMVTALMASIDSMVSQDSTATPAAPVAPAPQRTAQG